MYDKFSHSRKSKRKLAMPGEVFEVGKGSHETHPSFQVC
jgi:hypothetical protein